MISTYRLGDLVILDLEWYAVDAILNDHPNSIGAKYILQHRNNPSNKTKIDIITEIVLDRITQNIDFLPKDIENSTLIHLRLGDVIAGNNHHEIVKRPLEVEHLKKILANDNNKKYVIGKCFFANTSSNNYEECVNLSNIYLQNVIRELNAEHFDSQDADIDLCCAVKSKVFIQGKGFYSKLIVEIRKKLNLINVETATHD